MVEKRATIAAGRVQRVYAEKEALRRCEHPSICKLLHTDKDDRALYFYLEPVLGGNLNTHRRACVEQRMPAERVAIYAVQLLDALQHLLDKAIIHRDIKPQNLLLDRRGCVKLCDFGCAKCLDESVNTDLARTFTYIGTPQYMAPEMRRRIGHTFRVDWWAAGVVFAELVCGIHAGMPEEGCDSEPGLDILTLLDQHLPGRSRFKTLISGLIEDAEDNRIGPQNWREVLGTDIERWTLTGEATVPGFDDCLGYLHLTTSTTDV